VGRLLSGGGRVFPNLSPCFGIAISGVLILTHVLYEHMNVVCGSKAQCADAINGKKPLFVNTLARKTAYKRNQLIRSTA